jgi:hypothetical protein
MSANADGSAGLGAPHPSTVPTSGETATIRKKKRRDSFIHEKVT